MATNNFKAFALDPNANVMSQADWEALPALLSGFTAGKASSAQVNKAIRQATTIAALVGQFIANSGADALDNADVNGLVTKFTNALTTNLGLGTASKLPAGGGVFSGTGRVWIPVKDSTSGNVVNFLLQWGSCNNGGSGKDGSLTYGSAFPTAFGGIVFYGNDTSNGGFIMTKSSSGSSLTGTSIVFRDLSTNYPFVASRLLSGGYFAWGW